MRFAALTVIGFLASVLPADSTDPWAVLTPCVAMSAAERSAVAKGSMVSRIVPSNDRQIAAFATTRVHTTPEVLIHAARNITELKKSALVVSSAQFSDPPRLSDLDTLTLAPRDLDTLASCDVRLFHHPWALRPYSGVLTKLPQRAVRDGKYMDLDGMALADLLGLPAGWPLAD